MSDNNRFKLTSIGTGAFGFALLYQFHKYLPDRCDIFGYDQDEMIVDSLSKERTHPYFHRQFSLHHDVRITNDIAEAVEGAEVVFLAVPSQYTRPATQSIKPFLKSGVSLVNTSKALDYQTGKRLSEVVREELVGVEYDYYSLAGGTIAGELLQPGQLGASLAGGDYDKVSSLSEMLSTPKLKLYPSDDLVGVEHAGSLKNVISVISGIIDGMELSFGTQTYAISRAASEIEKLVVGLGGKPETFSLGSQCWGNDMIMSALGNTRNREYGQLIGQGYSPQKALETLNGQNKSVESVNTIGVLEPLINPQDYPLLSGLCDVVLNKSADPGIILEVLR